MIHNYPLVLQMDTDEGTYALLIGDNKVAEIQPEEPLTAPDALRMLLSIDLVLALGDYVEVLKDLAQRPADRRTEAFDVA